MSTSADPAGVSPDNDEIDVIVAAWRRERPDLDVSPLEVLSRVHRIARRLDLARKQAYTAHGLDASGFDVLTALRRAGSPYELTPGQLVAETLVTSGTMTNRIDRLEQSGDVSREPDPDDRRGTRVRLTQAGKARIDAAFEALVDSERGFLAPLGAQEEAHLAALLKQLGAAIPAD